MIEDALRSARTVQRLLLVALAAALVFLLSLDDATGPRRRLDKIDRLTELASSDYAHFVEDRVEQELGDQLTSREASLEAAIEERLEREGLRVFEVIRLSRAWARPRAWVVFAPRTIEAVAISLVLPVMCQLLIVFRAAAFEVHVLWVVAPALLGATTSAMLGSLVFEEMRSLRGRLGLRS